MSLDFLKAEIARKKKQLESQDVIQPNKKYFKRGDLAAKLESEYWQKQKKLKTDEASGYDSGRNSETSDLEPGTSKHGEEVSKLIMSRKEVIRRLRERNEPILCFGESEMDAFQRLKKLEILAPEVNKGYKNDMKTAMDKVDEDYLMELIKSSGQEEQSKIHDVKVKDDGTTWDDLVAMSADLGKGDSDADQVVLLRFMKLLLTRWGQQLNERSPEMKQSFKGKLAAATHSQTLAYLRPLLRKLKAKRLSQDILHCLVDVVKFLLERHYIKANEAYLEMAIGNAPWPIGVTMVGIHARTGREKIYDKNVAHVLNDETQRKYIQGLKRLMVKCQEIFPTAPHRSVNYIREED